MFYSIWMGKLMSNFFRIACLLIPAFALAFSEASLAQTSPKTLALRDLVSPTDPLAQQDLTFDTTFAQLAIQYFDSTNAAVLSQLAHSPAAQHLLDHARNFDYDVPKDSTRSLVARLLQPSPHSAPACPSACSTLLSPSSHKAHSAGS